MKPVTRSFLLVILLALFVPAAAADAAPAASAPEAWLVEKAAVELGLSPSAIQQASVQRRHFPLSGVTLFQVKFTDQATGSTHAQVLDETGAAKDLDQARQAEEAAHDARLARLLSQTTDLTLDAAAAKLKKHLHGRLSDMLLVQLETMEAADADAAITVAVWLKAEHVHSLERPDLGHHPAAVEAGDAPLENRLPAGKKEASQTEGLTEAAAEREALAKRVESVRKAQDELRFRIEDARNANLTHLKAQMVEVQRPLLAALHAMGFAPRYVSPLAPLIYVDLPKPAILELVFKEGVDTIYGPNVNRDMLNNAKPTQKADIVDNWFGFDGTGVDLAITEDSRVEFGNPYLNAGVTRVPADPNVDDHATACTGMVASQHGTYQGIAQGVNLFSANGTSYSDANMAAAMDWAAINQNVDVMNNSWGGNSSSGAFNEHDRHADYLVRNNTCTLVVSAGNDGDVPSHYVGSPGKGYNVITVGAYDDNNSLSWDGDSIAPYSSFNDPSTGCEKPEVAASGSLIYSTLMSSPWLGYAGSGSGTSYAAPMVSGAAALLMDRNATLESWPETVKAILMATALHNIEGSSRLSEKDGAGGVDMRAAFHAADEGWWSGRTVYQADLPVQYSFYAFAGQTIRAAIAWDSNPNNTYTTDPLEADLDLRLRNPSGTIVASSSSSTNSFEVIEYTAAETGNYTLEAYVWSWSGSNYTYLGAAWWPGERVLSTAIQTYDTPPISRDYYRFNPNAGYWNVVGIRSPAASTDYNYNIYLYGGSAFSDPADYNSLEDSTLSSTLVDYVVVDANHAPDNDYFVEVAAITGSGNYPIQFWNPAGSFTDGTYTTTITSLFVLQVQDVAFSANVRKYFALKVESGNADLGMALHDSNPATSSSFYQGRSNRVVEADSAGAGGSESMSYLSADSDELGLVVFNNGSSTNTTFKLYIDSTAPTGSILINGGAASTTSTNVTLTLSAEDSQTGVSQMRFGNSGEPWSAWEPYGTSKAWTLPSGDGTKTVYVQFQNNAGMISSQYSDSIVLTTAEVCECDLYKDGKCNILDYQLFIQDWGRTDCGTPPGTGGAPNNCECDLNKDGKCNILDYQLFIQDWGRTDCP